MCLRFGWRWNISRIVAAAAGCDKAHSAFQRPQEQRLLSLRQRLQGQ
ncbi:hypothetical protein C4K10_0311 [Pseudomonas chlororaphis subsp. aureofaciens]|nr:hypothetical protein C4K10_0311 [Pseudomonas chlororaphis subsp. aureofaciens]